MSDKEVTKLPRPIALKKSFKMRLMIMSLPIFLYHSLATKDYWRLLFISCIALYAPILWTAFGIYLAFKLYSQFRETNVSEIENSQNKIISSLQMNRLEEFAQAIDANPDVLYCDYHQRSLMAWCQYYKNTKAQNVVEKMMKKYPKKESLAA